MKLLAVETAASVLSVAVSNDEEIFAGGTIAGTRHSELVMELIDGQMKKAGLLPEDLDGVLCMGGPGSFTGLRIGYSIAKALALSLSIPFAPVPTLECIANNGRFKQGLVLAAIEARKNAYFNAFFNDGNRLSEDKDSSLSQITDDVNQHIKNGRQITLTGYGSETLYESLPENLKTNIILVNDNKGYAKELIAIAKNKNIFSNDNAANLYSGPEYIRKTDAEIALAR